MTFAITRVDLELRVRIEGASVRVVAKAIGGVRAERISYTDKGEAVVVRMQLAEDYADGVVEAVRSRLLAAGCVEACPPVERGMTRPSEDPRRLDALRKMMIRERLTKLPRRWRLNGWDWDAEAKELVRRSPGLDRGRS